jgi:hypothetical protein
LFTSQSKKQKRIPAKTHFSCLKKDADVCQYFFSFRFQDGNPFESSTVAAGSTFRGAQCQVWTDVKNAESSSMTSKSWYKTVKKPTMCLILWTYKTKRAMQIKYIQKSYKKLYQSLWWIFYTSLGILYYFKHRRINIFLNITYESTYFASSISQIELTGKF